MYPYPALQLPAEKLSAADNSSDSESAINDDVRESAVNVKKIRRRKRRGVIEKRRRDRINGCLTELKKLVPTAMDKQTSTKLEKAEILQLTVDHLKNLNSRGINLYQTDAATLALDYRNLGFHECITEVSRFLALLENPDLGDSLRARILSHLDTYSSHYLAHAQTRSRAQYGQRFYGSSQPAYPNMYANPTKKSPGVRDVPGPSYYSYLDTKGFNTGGASCINQLENAYLAASRLAGSTMSSCMATNNGFL